ncbi:bifunctional DNA-binding transcriptional regulator/O6-methylguanine-DNA methyltransferase Ada [Cupriavidus respiraculi]|uniref:Bifunctional transcriptional activator/DNA repair enzyme Ada n=1 Tax=Cupriavidus respiraculi TaxID=195930 RepID=A0ABN7Y8Y0_9BURK|nr:bifunctional DNA-binding transcriptional regulator/O6-methylguanine-DNA methyltransferase Ada [Cupriavidus respiraculi]CAG9168637.1 Bifunctional transcriptional activator/DNA repair enzyme Ada [Cupriavidus respiraculi]
MNTIAEPHTSPADALTDDPRWRAVIERDANADGTFFYSVRTTGVYCRPSCGARRPLRENVGFHATAADAERAGFRPCKRCKPGQPTLAQRHAAMVVAACRQIESADEPPSLATLAAAAGTSPHHFHRIFRQITGVTPADYVSAHRGQRVRERLARGASVTEAIYDAGFQSNGRFYAEAARTLGMKPSTYRAGGRDTDIRFAIGQCSLGAVLVASTAQGICAISLGEDPDPLLRELQDRFPAAELIGGDADYERVVARVVAMIEAPGQHEALPLDVRGTVFQQRVWQALREIPAGETASYAEIAQRIGAPAAVRAVAQACGANTIAVAIPCHRVVRQDGALSGYRWGVERKRQLLAREAGQ